MHHFLSKPHVTAGTLPEGLNEYIYDEEPHVEKKPFTQERAWSLYDKLSSYISEKNRGQGIWTMPLGARVKYRSQAAMYADQLEAEIEHLQSELDRSRASDSDSSTRPPAHTWRPTPGRARADAAAVKLRRSRGGSISRGGRTSKLQAASQSDRVASLATDVPVSNVC